MNQVSPSPLDHLIKTWSKLELPDQSQLTGLEIHEVLWLALQQREIREIEPSLTDPKPPEPLPKEELEVKTSDNTLAVPPKPPEINVGTSHLSISPKEPQMTIPVPDASAIGEPLNLARALRPLMRQVPSDREMVLDEEATVERMAELRLRLPVQQPALETWLDLALVVDESASMSLWRTTLQKLIKLLTNYGVFRDVRLFSLRTNERGQILLKPKLGKLAQEQRDCRINEILDPSGNRLILVVTDGIGEHWYQSAILEIFKRWSKSGPMALIQMLPEKLWSRTGLSQAKLVRFGSLTPGVANQHLLIKEVLDWDDSNLNIGLKIPIFTLEPEVALRWSEMVAGKSQVAASGLVFPVNSSSFQADSADKMPAEAEEPENLTPLERVQQFRNLASPLARKLASLVSASPVITLPVVRLIQKNLLKKSGQIHLAEVFLGGLLEPEAEITPETNPDAVIFNFIEEDIRYKFLEVAPVSDSAQIVEAISADFDQRLGLTLNVFEVSLHVPGDKMVNETSFKAFARFKAQILNRLGGEYARLARKLLEPGKNYAIAIGINQYRNLYLTPLSAQYPVRDAVVMQQWFSRRGFEQVDLLTDVSPPNFSESESFSPSHPTQEGWQQFWQANFSTSVLSSEDTLWFYFSGYSIYSDGQDYLLLADSDLSALEETALSLTNLVRQLQSSGAGKVILLLDADRNGQRPTITDQTYYQAIRTNLASHEVSSLEEQLQGELRKEQGLIIFYASNSQKGSYEIEQLQQGGFTHALQESLVATQGNLSIEHLEQFLAVRVTELKQQYNLPTQSPQSFVAPRNLREWIPFPSSLQVFEYQTPKVNRRGEIIKQDTKLAQYLSENLGNNITLEMVAIPGGTFMMGSPKDETERYGDESPQHEVTVPAFLMGKYPVTQAQWRSVAALEQVNRELNPDPSNFKGDNLPVEQISWYEAVEFCDRLSKHTGQKYRLPSEAEWEYACRAGTATPFNFGETITEDLASYNAEVTYADEHKGKSANKTTPVGIYKANAFGLYDMHGNVLEWCYDHWHGNYKGAPKDSSPWINEATEEGNDNQYRLRRGGSWNGNPGHCRSAYRLNYDSNNWGNALGFRAVVCGART